MVARFKSLIDIIKKERVYQFLILNIDLLKMNR